MDLSIADIAATRAAVTAPVDVYIEGGDQALSSPVIAPGPARIAPRRAVFIAREPQAPA